jgi:hypothetical protein
MLAALRINLVTKGVDVKYILYAERIGFGDASCDMMDSMYFYVRIKGQKGESCVPESNLEKRSKIGLGLEEQRSNFFLVLVI